MSKASTQVFRYAVTIGVAFAAVTTPTALAAPGDIVNLGALGESSYGGSINNAGQVSGTSYNTPIAFARAFLYSGGTMHDLGTLGGTNSNALGLNEPGGLNEAGQVAGTSGLSNGSARAFRYSGVPGAGGSMANLGTLGGSGSVGTTINNLGHVTGASSITGNLAAHAFRSSGPPGSGGAMVDLGTLGGIESFGLGINDAGQVVGYSFVTGNESDEQAFLYTGTSGAGGSMVALGTLGGRSSVAFSINNAGQIAGFSELSIDSYAASAFRYTGTPGAGGTMVALGTLGGSGSIGYGINDAGYVVGNAQRPDGITVAALWQTDASNRAIDLDEWLDAMNPTLGARWTLVKAADINDNGLVTGYGLYNDGPSGLSDGERAYILDASSLVSRRGDISGDDQFTAADIDLLCSAIRAGTYAAMYDINADNQLTLADLTHEVQQYPQHELRRHGHRW